MNKYIILSAIMATSSVYANDFSLEGENSLVTKNAVDKCLDLLESKKELSSRFWRYDAVRALDLLVHEENVSTQVQVDRVNRLKDALAKAFKCPDNNVDSYVDLAKFEKHLLAYESELLKLQQKSTSAGTIGESVVVTADDDAAKDADKIKPWGKIKTCVNGIEVCMRRIEDAKPDDKDLYTFCVVVLSGLQALQKTTMPLAEQLYLCKSAIRCIGIKIKSMTEHPTQVLRLAVVQQKLIAHAQNLLKSIPADDSQQ
jgi:hypothetical protein